MHLDSVCTFLWHLFQSCHGSKGKAEDSLLTCWQSRKQYIDSINSHNKIDLSKNILGPIQNLLFSPDGAYSGKQILF